MQVLCTHSFNSFDDNNNNNDDNNNNNDNNNKKGREKKKRKKTPDVSSALLSVLVFIFHLCHSSAYTKRIADATSTS